MEAAESAGKKRKLTLHKGGKPMLGEFDRVILDWFDEKRERGIAVSNEDIKREGRAQARKLGLDQLKVSTFRTQQK